MKWIELLVLTTLFIFLFIGIFVLWANLPKETLNFEAYHANISKEFPTQSAQFYKNTRYPDKKISYYLSKECSAEKKENFKEAIRRLEETTVLSFYQSETPEILITCSNTAPESTNENHFIAGEGGPTEIVNSTVYAIVLSGQISLYRAESCPKPQVATHELLHALGFNHNSNQESIMYPVTECGQTIDPEITDTINLLYSIPSEADLIIENVKANKTGRLLNIDALITNQGFKDIENSSLTVTIFGDVIKEFEIGSLKVGTKKNLKATVKIPKSTRDVYLKTKTLEPEISKENNDAKISLIDS